MSRINAAVRHARNTPTAPRKPRVLEEGDVVDRHDHPSPPWNHQWHREVGGVEEVWGVSEEVCA